MGGVCSLSCKKQNPLRVQGQNGTFDAPYRTFTILPPSSAQFGLLSFDWVISCFFSSLRTARRWRSVRSRPCAKSSSWTACRHGTTPHSPRFQTDYNKREQIPLRRDWANYGQLSSYLGKATHCSVSPCSSSDASLWQNKGGERMYSDQDEGCWKCDNNPDRAEDPSTPQQSSSVSFSGPYIFCQVRPLTYLVLCLDLFRKEKQKNDSYMLFISFWHSLSMGFMLLLALI